ncbi:MAG: hypothetical protein ACAH59_08930, partial [Pseudobdellovibrionaceae bacterium]
ITYANSDYSEFSVTSWSGAETTGNPWDQAAAATPAKVAPPYPNPPSVTTTVTDTLVVVFGMSWAGWDPLATMPSGYTMREQGSNGNNNDVAVGPKALAAATTEDPGTFTSTLNPGNTADTAAVTIALKAVGASGPAGRIRHRVINQ